VNQSDAEAKVVQFVSAQLPTNVAKQSKLYRIEGKLTTNDVITSIKGPVNFSVNDVGDEPQWAFFLDKAPGANWEHPAAYILVLQSGAVVMQDDTAPPSSSMTSRLTLISPAS
jgi:hypothetical protein